MFLTYARLPVIATLITVVCVSAMVALGVWQLNRMEQKQQRLITIESKRTNNPIHPASLPTDILDIRDLPVTFSGRLDPSVLFYLDNQVSQGKVGYQLLTIVRSNDKAFLVNLGWVPAPTSRSELPNIDLSNELTTFSGVTAVPGENPMVSETINGQASFPVRIQKVDFALMEAISGVSFPPFVIMLTKPEDARFIRNWQPVVMAPEKHLGYAIQWFGLAFAAVVIFIILLIRRAPAHD